MQRANGMVLKYNASKANAFTGSEIPCMQLARQYSKKAESCDDFRVHDQTEEDFVSKHRKVLKRHQLSVSTLSKIIQDVKRGDYSHL